MSMEVYATCDKKGACYTQSLIKIVQRFHSTIAFFAWRLRSTNLVQTFVYPEDRQKNLNTINGNS